MSPGRPDKWIRIPSITSSSVASKAASHKRSASEMEQGGPLTTENPENVPAIPADQPLDPALLPEGDPDVEIESLIIPALEELHAIHIRDANEAKHGKNGDAC